MPPIVLLAAHGRRFVAPIAAVAAPRPGAFACSAGCIMIVARQREARTATEASTATNPVACWAWNGVCKSEARRFEWSERLRLA